MNSLECNPEHLEAIADMPEPYNKEELATFMGMITYPGKFVQNLSAVSAPLRELTQKDMAWSCESRHQEAFSELKQHIADAPTLKFYDVRQPVIASIDASKHGYGAVISQESGPISYASRCLTPEESNYEPVKGKMSTVLYSSTRFHGYIYGQKVTVETDYEPVEGKMSTVLYSSTRFHDYIYGQKVTVETDHKPLLELWQNHYIS